MSVALLLPSPFLLLARFVFARLGNGRYLLHSAALLQSFLRYE